MGKVKLECTAQPESIADDKESRWDALLSQVEVIASPMASRKLAKRIYKVVKRAEKAKQIRRGVREVQKFIRKGEKGIVLLAGNTSPIDVICHIPVMCEDHCLPYCYIPSKEDLGTICCSRRPTCAMMIKSHQDYHELFDELSRDVKALPLPL